MAVGGMVIGWMAGGGAEAGGMAGGETEWQVEGQWPVRCQVEKQAFGWQVEGQGLVGGQAGGWQVVLPWLRDIYPCS